MLDSQASSPDSADFSLLFQDPALSAQQRPVAASEGLFASGDPAGMVYIVQRGQVRLYQSGPAGSERLVDIYGPGHWFGAESLAGRATFVSRAVAAAPTVLWQVPADKLLGALMQHPDLATALLQRLAERLIESREDAGRLVFDDCNGRLLKTLVRFSDSAAATRQEHEVTLHITHQQLAQAVGVARETVSLALTQLRQQNLLRTGRNRLQFNPDVLRQFVSGRCEDTSDPQTTSVG
jgi:CRP/FNR family transcriptional regulator